MSASKSVPVVVDVGSDSCKAGFSGDESPKIVLPTVVGQQGGGQKYIGQDALDPKLNLTYVYPVQRGAVTDWQNIEVILHHIFKDKLAIQTTDHPVLMTETPQNPKVNREKMAELMFEKFKVPVFFSCCQAVMCLYSSGRTTGLVLDIGSGVTTAVPVYEGYSLVEAVVRMDLAGSDITEYLKKLLSERGISIANSESHIKTMKEKLCYVSQNFQKELSEWPASSTASYSLPDGKTISLETERIRSTEILFQPSLCGRSEKHGIHQMINSAIMACEMDTRKSLYNNLILAGGSSLFAGLQDRLKHELKSFGPLGAEAKISAPKERPLSAWIGGSLLASLPTFETNWISKKDYEESGSQIVHTRCF